MATAGSQRTLDAASGVAVSADALTALLVRSPFLPDDQPLRMEDAAGSPTASGFMLRPVWTVSSDRGEASVAARDGSLVGRTPCGHTPPPLLR